MSGSAAHRASRAATFSGVLDLDGAAALDVLVGEKAAALGRARRRGLPVLPGFVVAAQDGSRLVAAFAGLCASQGPHAAALALMEAAARVDLSRTVEAARRLGPRLAVRSSSGVEGDPALAGAFSSYLDVEPEEVPTAVAGCWASVFKPAVLDHCARTGRSLADVCPAALVQPMVDPQGGGIARVRRAHGDRRSSSLVVEVLGVRGSPAPLLAGWSRAEVLPEEWVRGVEDLARDAGGGAPVTVEWAVVEDRPLLLQVRPEPCGTEVAPDASGHRSPASGAPSAPARRAGGREGRTRPAVGAGGAPRGVPPVEPAVARAVARFGGPLGDELVLPWMLASPPADAWASARHARRVAGDAGPPADLPGAALLARFDRTAEVALALVAAATARGADDAPEEAARLLGRLAAGDLGALAALRAVPASDQLRVLDGFGICARVLRASGALAHEAQFWALSAEEARARLRAGVGAGWHAQRLRSWRWQPLLQSAVARWGRSMRGEGAAPGRAAGRGRRLTSAADLRRVAPGDVVVLEHPFPQAAPALWVASGVVAESGSGAAHLVDVARSVRVPAVVAAGSVAAEEEGTLVLVDGDRGEVIVLAP